MLKMCQVGRQNFVNTLWWAVMLPSLRTADLDNLFYHSLLTFDLQLIWQIITHFYNDRNLNVSCFCRRLDNIPLAADAGIRFRTNDKVVCFSIGGIRSQSGSVKADLYSIRVGLRNLSDQQPSGHIVPKLCRRCNPLQSARH